MRRIAKEQIDIERLLEWAYRVQCVDRHCAAFTPQGPSASPAGSLGQYAALGTRVDNSSFAARAAGFRMPDDAMIIHDAVLALDEMWIEWRGGGEVDIWDRARAAQEGQSISQLHGDWVREPIIATGGVRPLPVRLEQAGVMALVIIHAKAGTQPDYHPDWQAPRGRPPVHALDRKGKKQEGMSVETVMHARACYLVWRAALALLAAQLDGALAGYHVSGPSASEAPWVRGKTLKRA